MYEKYSWDDEKVCILWFCVPKKKKSKKIRLLSSLFVDNPARLYQTIAVQSENTLTAVMDGRTRLMAIRTSVVWWMHRSFFYDFYYYWCSAPKNSAVNYYIIRFPVCAEVETYKDDFFTIVRLQCRPNFWKSTSIFQFRTTAPSSRDKSRTPITPPNDPTQETLAYVHFTLLN